MEYPTEKLQKLLSFYKSDIQNGLLLDSVEEHRQKWGENRFADPKKERILSKIKNHLLEMMNLFLLFVAALSAYLAFLNDQNYIKTIVVSLIIIINITVSIFQKNRAETALVAKKKALPTSTVIQESKKARNRKSPSTELVCGDIIAIKGRIQIGADVLLIEVSKWANHHLQANLSLSAKTPLQKRIDSLTK